MDTVPYPAPQGFRWIFVKEFVHWRSKQVIRAIDHGKQAFCILVRTRRGN